MVIPVIIAGAEAAAAAATTEGVTAAAASAAGEVIATKTVAQGALNTLKTTGKILSNAIDTANQLELTNKALEGDDAITAAAHVKNTANLFTKGAEAAINTGKGFIKS